MKGKIFVSVFFALILLMGCGAGHKKLEGSVDGLPVWVNDFPPEDILWGIGAAKTESDGESILLAEDRARSEIARQINSNVSLMSVNYDGSSSKAEVFRSLSKQQINGSTVIKRDKGQDGTWFCLVELKKKNINPDQSLFNFLINNAVEPLQRNSEIIMQTNMRTNNEIMTKAGGVITVDKIPEWVLDMYNYVSLENTVTGVGAARLDNDGDAIYLARERARRSMAHSLSADIIDRSSSISYFDDPNNQLGYQEYNTSVSSVYDHTEIEMQLLNLAKTKDGTWWIMLGCVTE